MAKLNTDAPLSTKPVDENGLLVRAWQDFMSLVSGLLSYFSDELVIELTNNQTTAVLLSEVKFDKGLVSAGHIDYYIQRITNSDEKIEAGTTLVGYRPKTDTWTLANSPTSAGVTLSINSNGQILYTTTNQTGTKVLSRIALRIRYIRAKSSLYSKMGTGGTK